MIDLRTTAEILLEGRGPLRDVPEVVHRHFSLLLERGHHTDVFAVEEDDSRWATCRRAGWRACSRGRPPPARRASRPPSAPTWATSATGRDDVVGALRTLSAREPGASIVHCAAGKDRTGVVVALALAVAGVPHEEIVADYALTADVIDALVAKLAASPTYAEDMEQRDIASHTPRAETMDRVLTVLDERFGGPVGLAGGARVRRRRAGRAERAAARTESGAGRAALSGRVARPRSLCRYMAASASRSSCSAVHRRGRVVHGDADAGADVDGGAARAGTAR